MSLTPPFVPLADRFGLVVGVGLCALCLGLAVPLSSVAQRARPDSQQLRPEQLPPGGLVPLGLVRVRGRIAEIRGLTGRWRSVPAASQPSQPRRSADESTRPPGVSRSDMEAVEERLRQLIRELLTREDSVYWRDGTVYVPVPYAIPPPGVQPMPPGAPRVGGDTVQFRTDSAAVASDPVPRRRDSVRIVRDTLFRDRVERVERRLLDAGVFRAFEVNFEFGSSTLASRATRTLDAVGAVVERYPEFVIEVAGHTDAIGSAEVNRRLSQARANSVREYLLDRFDIEPEQLVARGYGEDRPIASNDVGAGRALNRRVEFRVITQNGAGR